MLDNREDCAALLRCPRTGAPLSERPDGQLAAISSSETVYPVVRDVPVLVDFDRSVLERDAILQTALASPVTRTRRRGLAALAKRLVSPPKKTTRDNVVALVAALKKRSERPRVLIIGGGTVGQGMEPLYDDPDLRLIAFDIYFSPDIHFIADAHAIPLPDGSVDAVIVQAVLEHVLQPAEVVAEIWRVLKDSGLIYAETPFLQHVHEGPYDFTRFTESGHRYLFRRFSMLRSGASGGAATQLLWSIDYFARSLFRSAIAGKAAKLAFFWLNYFDRVIPDDYASDAASGIYFLGEKAMTEITARDVIRFYRGAQ